MPPISLNNRLRFCKIRNYHHYYHYSSDIPPAKLPPMKYHLFVKKSRSSEDDSRDTEMEDEDLEMSPQEDIQFMQQPGNIQFTTTCKVISPGVVIPGSLAITGDALYFTADEESEELQGIDPLVRCVSVLMFVFVCRLYTSKK